jgi:nucleoside-diphosphate-sugar epimerase
MMNHILITGATGLLGSNMVSELTKLTLEPENLCRIIAVGKRTLSPITYPFLNEINYVKADINDYEAIDHVINHYDIDYIYHFAAEAIVKSANDSPLRALETNMMGTANVLESARQNHVKGVIAMACFDDKTQAFTPNGIMDYINLEIGDLVYSINKYTGNIELKPITDIYEYDYEGNLEVFQNRNSKQAVTPNHKIFDNDKKFKQADSIQKYNYIWGNWFGRFDEQIDIFNFLTDEEQKINHQSCYNNNRYYNTADLFYLVGLYLGDGFTNHQLKSIESKTGLSHKQFIKLRDNKGRFRKIKENEKKNNKLREYNIYSIFLDIPENDKARKKAEDVLNKLGIKFNIFNDSSGEHIHFSSKYLLHFFDKLGKDAKNKHIPKWMLSFNKNYLEKLLEGLIDSDGCYQKSNQRTFKTTSKSLLEGVLDICMKLNLQTGFRENQSKKTYYIKEKRYINSNVSYDVWISGKEKNNIVYKKQNPIQYKGKVWCVSVKDNNNLCVIRNNRLFFSGNSDKYYGQSPNIPYKETDRPMPSGVYEVSKTCSDFICQMFGKNFDVPVISIRGANLFGPGDWNFTRLVPNTIIRLLEGKKPMLWADVKDYQREFIYVKDAVDILVKLMSKADEYAGESVNLGVGSIWKVEDFIHEIIEAMNADLEPDKFIHHLIDTPIKEHYFHEIPEQSLNLGKLQQMYGGDLPNRTSNIIECLRETIHFYSDVKHGYALRKW